MRPDTTPGTHPAHFIPSDPDKIVNIQRIAEDVLSPVG